MNVVWAIVLVGAAGLTQASPAVFVPIPAQSFLSSVRYEDNQVPLQVPPFHLMARPVSNAQFADFVQRHPQWQRGRPPAVMAGNSYLQAWATPVQPGSQLDSQAPVTHVSWYAAQAYCQDLNARLPTFLEWEVAAAASPLLSDARTDRAWRQRLVGDGTPYALEASAQAPANVYGVYQLHGSHWEWSEDFSSLLSAGDRRGQDNGQRMAFCGATALTFTDRQDVAVIKRFTLQSALQPSSTLSNLGFRCARSTP